MLGVHVVVLEYSVVHTSTVLYFTMTTVLTDPPPPPLLKSSQAGRYFATGESESVEERVQRDPGDIAGWVELAQRATGREEALRYLKQGLEANNSSEVQYTQSGWYHDVTLMSCYIP